MGRESSDEAYVIDLCDEVLGIKGSRQHRFDWLRGDPSLKTGNRATLPVDAYWESLSLVVEYAERQHTEAVAFFDKPDALTVSGVHRGGQRRIYDQRRRDLIPKHGLRLLIIPASDFQLRRQRIVRRRNHDLEVVRALLGKRFGCANRR